MTVEKRMSDSGEEFPVDDDPICLMVLENLLRKCQYHVLVTDWNSEISKEQDRLTYLLQDVYTSYPQYREIVRMILSTVGRGGEGDVGQRIRDEILVIQVSAWETSPSLYCNSPSPSPITFQNRRNVPRDVSVILIRTEFGTELRRERMTPRLPPPPQPAEPDASNNARLLETVIDRLQQQNTTLMEQNATLMQQNQSAMQSLEASRANSETTQRQLMEILAATRHTTGASPSLYCNLPSPSPITFQNRRNVPGDVSVILIRTEFGTELVREA
ncbi:Alpha-glucan water [Vigna angularis]|uniref:Alpha-glucan water n=1 Tax=Phaseolus angularis TaxID=3914 RepID=A0A8T0KUQ2_PHAAN|nr:Alpha-glucan water [Vigna angularis]